jgi:NAD(P)-dependent dehydrogenase (short-subunit alcohol dehydrogenase family)
MDPLFDISGKQVLVTGGSRGIGLMIAAGLLDRGARVIVSARKAEPLERAAAALRERGECEAVVADLSRPDGIDQLAAAVRRRADRLDVLVNNAGAAWGDPVDAFRMEGWDKVIDTNLRGPFFLASALLDLLRAAATGEEPARIINIGSVNGLRPPAETENYPYGASKAAIHMLSRHMARRLAPEHITVNALAPGWFESKMTAHLLDEEATRRELLGEVPLGRVGGEGDIVGAIVFLASRAGAYMTGTVIPVDGGLSGC